MATDPVADDPIRVVLVEHHAIMRAGIRQLLAYAPGLALVGEAADGESWLRLVQDLAGERQVDVVIAPISGSPTSMGSNWPGVSRRRVPRARSRR